MKKLILTPLFILLAIWVNAQSYLGTEADNYTGVHGIIFNPANVTDSRLQAEVNLFSGDALFGTDYLALTLDNGLSLLDDFDFQEDITRFPSEQNNFLLNVDVVGPSFMFNLSPKSSIGVVTRVRGILNVNNINGELFESLADEFDLNEDFSFNMEQLNTITHVWGEVGLAYGRTVINNEQNFLKAGVTFKYLLGAGVAQGNSNSVSGNYSAATNTLTTSGSFLYNASVDLEDEEYSFEDTTPGFGADIGFVYEWRPNHADYDEYSDDYRGLNKYKLKLGVALTDIGSITYTDVETSNYDINGTVTADELENDLGQALEDNFPSTTTIEDVQVNLPTAIRLNLDYSFSKHFFTSVNYIQPMHKKGEALTTRMLNVFTITPRYESKVFSFYTPISFGEFGGVDIGSGLRFGPLMLGSSTVISNLFSQSARVFNVYAGVKIPIYQRSKIKR